MAPAKVAASKGKNIHYKTESHISEESNPTINSHDTQSHQAPTSSSILGAIHRPADKIWEFIPKLPEATGNDHQRIADELRHYKVIDTIV
ncbi:hypothetical protein N7456_004551 [Penicillium angulare]|uniref:Uncharacterized protein n=1 Tax=Penicillium angulare TaxID=116970 RepID=A0A9W9FWN0_9EURO|nr:hypothetical protein N7456_004551 [Penicillium angulare]